MTTYYPSVLPVSADPSLVPAGIGDASTKVNGGAIKPRPNSLYADELVQIIYNIVGMAAALGKPDGTTAGSVFEQLLAMPAPVPVTSTAQLSTSQTLPAPAAGVSGGLTSAALTQTTDVAAPGGFKFSLDATLASAFGTGIWWIDQAVALSALDYYEVFIGVTTPTLGDEVSAGLAWCADATVGTAIAITVGINAAGTAQLAITRGDAPGGASLAVIPITLASGWLRIRVLGSRPVTADPPALIFEYEWAAFDGTKTYGMLTTLAITGISPWAASWNTSACDRVGFMLQSGPSGAANPINGVFTGFRIVRRV